MNNFKSHEDFRNYIQKELFVPRDHYKDYNDFLSKNEIQKRIEYHVIEKFLSYKIEYLAYPLDVEHIGEADYHPDFIISDLQKKYILEITQVTDQSSQQTFKKHNLGIETFEKADSIMQNPVTRIQESITKKNKKLPNYYEKTKIDKSILLVYYNVDDCYNPDPEMDDLSGFKQLISNFNHTHIIINGLMIAL